MKHKKWGRHFRWHRSSTFRCSTEPRHQQLKVNRGKTTKECEEGGGTVVGPLRHRRKEESGESERDDKKSVRRRGHRLAGFALARV